MTRYLDMAMSTPMHIENFIILQTHINTCFTNNIFIWGSNIIRVIFDIFASLFVM